MTTKRAVAQATAQGFQLHEPELWAFLSLNDSPTRPGFGKAGPGWLTALGRAQHITKYNQSHSPLCAFRLSRVETVVNMYLYVVMLDDNRRI